MFRLVNHSLRQSIKTSVSIVTMINLSDTSPKSKFQRPLAASKPWQYSWVTGVLMLQTWHSWSQWQSSHWLKGQGTDCKRQGRSLSFLSELCCQLFAVVKGDCPSPWEYQRLFTGKELSSWEGSGALEFLHWCAKAVAVVTDCEGYKGRMSVYALSEQTRAFCCVSPSPFTSLLNTQDAQREGWEQPCGVKVTAVRRRRFVMSGGGVRLWGGC